MLTCLAVGAALTGCTGGSGSADHSAQRILDDANHTMSALSSVTVDADSTEASNGTGIASRMTTDLKGRCAVKSTWAAGGTLEQIRIGDTDYVRPDAAYLKKSSGRDTAGTKDQRRWIKTPAGAARPGDGLAECTYTFTSFGVPEKGDRVTLDGRPAIQLVVHHKTDEEEGSYTFFVAAKGKPYILKVVYQGAKHHNATSFSAFDQPLNIQPPPAADVLDGSGFTP
ncbi:hypothetical protein [Streptomyces sp. HUAS TT7]|uniref:hypothetical protein n=1 Tax=Streptomyces sp. HUAS TT7 TaxID=3447507 RepID=UPI003F655F34